MKKLILLLAVALLFSSVTYAGEVHGKAFSKIEIYNGSGEEWGIDLYYNFWKYFSIGTQLTCITDGFGNIGFIPRNQNYDLYLTFKIENILLKLSQWCQHPVISSSFDEIREVYDGISLYAEFLF